MQKLVSNLLEQDNKIDSWCDLLIEVTQCMKSHVEQSSTIRNEGIPSERSEYLLRNSYFHERLKRQEKIYDAHEVTFP